MAEEKSLREGLPRGALADGVACFDALAREVKTRQIAQIQGAGGSEYHPCTISPDERWERSFATQAIGPKPDMPRIHGFSPPPMPKVSFDFSPPPGAAMSEPPKLDKPLAIGERLGRPDPRRGWFARLFHPRR